MDQKSCRQYTPEEKVAILRRHLIARTPVSDLREECGLHATVFCRWQKEFFEHGAAAFEKRKVPDRNRYQERIATPEEDSGLWLATTHETLLLDGENGDSRRVPLI